MWYTLFSTHACSEQLFDFRGWAILLAEAQQSYHWNADCHMFATQKSFKLAVLSTAMNQLWASQCMYCTGKCQNEVKPDRRYMRLQQPASHACVVSAFYMLQHNNCIACGCYNSCSATLFSSGILESALWMSALLQHATLWTLKTVYISYCACLAQTPLSSTGAAVSPLLRLCFTICMWAALLTLVC